MREHGVVSPLSERKKQSLSTVKREENSTDNNSSSNGRRRAGGMGVLVFEGKSTGQRPGERARGGNGLIGGRDYKQEKRKASEHLVAERKEKDDEGEEEENEAKGKPSLAPPAISKREDMVMALHWGHKKRPRCSRVDESSVLSRKTVRVKAEKVAGAAAGSTVTSIHAQVFEKRAQEWRLKPSIAPAELRNPKGGQRVGGSGEARGGVGADPDGDYSRGGGGAHAAPASPEKQDTISTRHSRNPNSPPAKDVPDHNGAEAPSLKLELEWPKIVICLSRKEKEEDFFIIKGTKLPQRPKRRSKAVEKSLIYCCPGSWLSDLSRGRYDVREKKCVKKKPRGLKAMESMESDSD